MDPEVPTLLAEIATLGQEVIGTKHDPYNQKSLALLAATQKLAIALQEPGLLIERCLQAVRPFPRQIGDF